MATQIKAPVFPESISEGTVATWHKKVGDAVQAGEVVVDIETDKVVLEVPATTTGVLGPQLKKQGESVKSQEVIGSIEEGVASATVSSAPLQTVGKPLDRGTTSKEAGPSARRALAQAGLDAQDVQGTGKDGRITAVDVKSKINTQSETSAQPTLVGGERLEKRVPMTRLRKTIATRLLEVTQSTAMLTTFNEVDMSPVMEIRARYKEAFEKKHGVKLGFMSFFTKAVTEALKEFPAVNSSLDGDDLVYHGYCDVGVAVSSPRGLVVPVLRDAQRMSLAEIELAIKNLATKARDGKLSLEEMQGGTFTITNGGVFGSMLSTPILNAPQSAILGMHNIVDRPVAIEGKVEIRPIMYVALSYDHRVIDGRESVSFLKMIKDYLEDPARFLINV